MLITVFIFILPRRTISTRISMSSSKIGVDELALWIFIVPEYDLCRVFVCWIIDRKTRHCSDDLSRKEIALKVLPDFLRGKYVIITILRYQIPFFLWYWLIPWEAEFLVSNSELNFPLL